MSRTDLLSLSPNDLASLCTRGKVKEAIKDLDSGITGKLDETPDGALRVEWSDGRVSELPSGATLRKGRCSCGAVDPCKHLVRLVLLYQQRARVDSPPVPTQPWDPGAISDADLASHFRPAALDRARQEFQAGVLVELVRGTRPVARFHVPGGNVRFLVPGDLRYTRCACAKPSPCEHVPLAVWAFRLLEADRRAGIVTAGATAPAAPGELLDALEQVLLDLAAQGVSGASRGWNERLSRLASRCEAADLVWPAEIVGELLQQQESYATHDARFDPVRVAELVGELVLRLDAIRNDTGLVPQMLIRGTRNDRPVKLGFGDYLGLGCGVHVGRKSVELAAYLHDNRNGGVVAVTRRVTDRELVGDRSPRSFGGLGGHVAVKGTSFQALGVGILQIDGGKRTPGHELLPGRASASVMVQDRFAWEEIAPPVLVEEFAELEDRLSNLPPSALRPRRLTEDFHVLRIAEASHARFDAATHQVQALVRDARGRQAVLLHPYTSRGKAGAEALLARLTAGKGSLLFVSGLVGRAMGGLVIRPTCLVWQEGDRRTALQPWVEHADEVPDEPDSTEGGARPGDPVEGHPRRIQEQLGELLLLGLTRTDDLLARRWRDLVQEGEGIGYARLATRVAALVEPLEQKAHTLRWVPESAARALLELAALTRLAADVAG